MTDEPVSKRFTIINERGLHARPMSMIVQLASRFDCDILVSNADGQVANAKSVMGLLLLCCSKGTTLEVRATGSQAVAAVDAIGKLIQSDFGDAG